MQKDLFRAPGFPPGKSLEIVTTEWQYYDTDEFNFDDRRVVPVKEQRRMGTQRGNKTTPQAPAIEVRAKGLPPVPVACRCRLWNFGSCLEKEPPRHDGTGTQLTMLRANVQIDVTENVAIFGPEQDDGYRYARLRCFITRGARVQCRKFHIAFYLDCVYLPPGMVVPGPDDSSFAIGDVVDNFPWARSSRMSISEKAMCPRLHDKTKKARSKALKNAMNGTSSNGDGSSTDESGEESSPKRLKKTPSVDTPASTISSRAAAANAISSLAASATKKTPSPIMSKGRKDLGLTPATSVFQGTSLLMPTQLGGIPPPPPSQGGLFAPPYLDRQMRMSRFSFPGFDEDVFQQGVGGDEGDLVSIESALAQGRRSSQFIGGQYWPYQQGAPYYLGQTGVPSQNVASTAGTAAVGVTANGLTPSSIAGGSSPLPVAGQSPSFGTLQGSLPFDFSGIGELNQRRLSAGGSWSAELQSRRLSTVDALGRLSSSPLPASQPGRGPEWEALFEAYAKALSVDKASPDYLTKKTTAMAEVYRAAETIEQRILQKGR